MIEFNVAVSTSTIARKHDSMLHTIKNMRIEPAACNNDVNKAKRKAFADIILQHIADGNFIVYFDETNYNLYCKRSKGGAKLGQRAIEKMPASKGPNIQVQCAVSCHDGLIVHSVQRASIRMEENAAFVETIHNSVKLMPHYQRTFADKKIVIDFDNAPCHS
ncbi:hypothetical protein DYB32_009560 [Aphanomyces invadans]|uniref:Tc1-like transposase DDE domain-containing protein n=1 Tax=Aphanomyces invadans TaxID=157072 RepID=A0A418AII0_9STRA|nr:hypothetical protein DYB32_009560 [Aphanomyces invadans]